jgi:hypothetical protein
MLGLGLVYFPMRPVRPVSPLYVTFPIAVPSLGPYFFKLNNATLRQFEKQLFVESLKATSGTPHLPRNQSAATGRESGFL